MRILLLLSVLISTISFFIPLGATAITGENTRFDWSSGQPAITDDATSACNDTAVARFDWSSGQPSIVHDATANCTAAAAGGGTRKDAGVIWFE